jgi:CheY-like chemotaxis protein
MMKQPPESEARAGPADTQDADAWTVRVHDLRQPLQALKILHGALRRAAAGMPAVLEMLDAQRDAIEALERRIDGLPAAAPRAGQPDVAAGAPRSGTPAAGSGPGILIVDDDALIRRAWERLLRAEGHRVSSAASLAETRALLAGGDTAFGLVITDYDLRDGGDGLAVVRAVRAATGAATPALMITGDPGAIGAEIAALENCRIATKPVDTAVLLDLARVALP